MKPPACGQLVARISESPLTLRACTGPSLPPKTAAARWQKSLHSCVSGALNKDSVVIRYFVIHANTHPAPWMTRPIKKMTKRWWVYQNTSKYDLRMVLVDEVMMRMRASVMTTPVMPAKYVKATYRPPTGFCEIIAHSLRKELDQRRASWTTTHQTLYLVISL